MSSSIDPRSCRVALLCGGKSNEREISLASGKGAREALETAGFSVTDIDPANKEDLKRLIEEPFDVAFLCLHGKYGEDGTVQGLLDIIGIPYTCSGVWSSALAMDKVKAKVFYEREGIPTPPSLTVNKGDKVDIQQVISSMGEKVVVKPGTEGSAIGVFIVEGAEAIEEALQKALDIDDEVLIERYISKVANSLSLFWGTMSRRLCPLSKSFPRAISMTLSRSMPWAALSISALRASPTM